MKPSPSVNDQEQKPSSLEELRHDIGVYTERVFLHSIALKHGLSHEQAADEIMSLFRSHMQAVIDESYELGRTHELERHNSKNSDERDTRQYDELLQLSAKYLEGDKTNHE